MRVAKEHGAPGADVVEELVTVRVVEILPASLFDDQRVATDGTKRAHGTVDSADENFCGPLKNFLGTAAFGFCLGLCRTHRGTFDWELRISASGPRLWRG